jgi:hypothetical protein
MQHFYNNASAFDKSSLVSSPLKLETSLYPSNPQSSMASNP